LEAAIGAGVGGWGWICTKGMGVDYRDGCLGDCGTVVVLVEVFDKVFGVDGRFVCEVW